MNYETRKDIHKECISILTALEKQSLLINNIESMVEEAKKGKGSLTDVENMLNDARDTKHELEITYNKWINSFSHD